MRVLPFFFFFFNDTATTEIYTLSLHDALPILGFLNRNDLRRQLARALRGVAGGEAWVPRKIDRKSTRLNSSHANISYAVFCLKKKKSLSRNIWQISGAFLNRTPDLTRNK